MSVTRHVIVRGLVQGVGYRDFVAREADRRGIEGWVRNRRDETVEAVFIGPAEAVEAMIEACRHGPPASQVAGIDQREASPANVAERRAGERFSWLPTV